VFLVFLYNSLVALKNKVKEAWADIDTQLKRRYDLIPNIVETVKGYMGHEKSTLEKVTELRTKAIQSQNFTEKAEAENMLSETLKSLFAVAENYPDLKANQNFLDLQNTLKEVEEHLQLSRRYYNGTVRDYNTKLQVFPNNLIAKQFGFTESEFFETKEEKQREAVQVSFQKPAEPPAPATPTPETQPTPPSEPPATPPPANQPTDAPASEPSSQSK
jgi:LemA protein